MKFMGFLGNMLTGGKGIAGANNAHLAELVVKRLTEDEKKLVAEKVIEMGIPASGHRETTESFIDFFNGRERLYQLNCIALALSELYLDANLTGESWMDVSHPFAIPTDSSDLQANASHFRRKHGITVSVGTEQIDIGEWAGFGKQTPKRVSTRKASTADASQDKALKMVIECPACQQQLRVPKDLHVRITCSKCANVFEVDKAGISIGDIESQFLQGIKYATGQNVDQNYMQAASHFLKAADLGHAEAQYNLACLYTRGQGVPQSDEQALIWFRRAALQNHAEAKNVLALYDNQSS